MIKLAWKEGKNLKRGKKTNKKESPEQHISFVFLLVLAVLFIIPILWIILSAFKDDAELLQAGGFLILPKTWTFKNFAEILSRNNSQVPIYKWYSNSIFVAAVHTSLSVLVVSMAAYAFSKLVFKGRDTLFLAILFITSFPSIVTIVPLYNTMKILGWLNSPWALIFPGLAGAFNIFLVKQFMVSIPDSLIEAGRIDGAGEIAVFFKLIFPLLKPILVIVGIFSFTNIWNDFFWPSIAINDVENLTLTAGLQLAKGTYEQYVSKMSAVAVVAIVPMIMLYCFAEKWFVKGVSISSGVKG